ncbi:MAG: histidinol dehydrogenase [Patescibacteria group bacterium]|nr:histidinol dehydrogenase [Patescibacteria group bacterium]
MKYINTQEITPQQLAQSLQRPAFDYSARVEQVQPIINKVKAEGDSALQDFNAKFDGIDTPISCVSQDVSQKDLESLDPKIRESFEVAIANITKFHESQKNTEHLVETMPGIQCWRESRAIDTVGLYIPGGTAVLPSTLMMLAIPAKIAGCEKIVVCTPPQKDGNISKEILALCAMLDLKNIYAVGGAHSVAAMAYGTEQIPKCDKIFGPGNQFVTVAKMLVSQDPYGAAIDMPAGPSEVLVVADEHANASFVAADLLSQAEHGVDSHVVCVVLSSEKGKEIEQKLGVQLMQLSRSEIAQQALEKSVMIQVSNRNEAIEVSNQYAPEHLILHLDDVDTVLSSITNTGSVFVGQWSPESVGDYASGTNHTLPTFGFAKSYSGVSLDSFVKKVTFQKLSKEGLQNISDTVINLADLEELDAHANAVKVRL